MQQGDVEDNDVVEDEDKDGDVEEDENDKTSGSGGRQSGEF